jgi:phosphatidylglycerophosphatase A
VTIRLAVLVCTFGYVGYSPIAPGTVGSLAGLAVYGVLRWCGAGPLVDALVIGVLFALGVWSGTYAERYFGSTDPGPGVIDEVVGMLMTLYLVPATWTAMLIGFCVFRALDVIKPFPANRLERLHGGLGMMADDAMAAVYSGAVMHLLLWLKPAWLAA